MLISYDLLYFCIYLRRSGPYCESAFRFRLGLPKVTSLVRRAVDRKVSLLTYYLTRSMINQINYVDENY